MTTRQLIAELCTLDQDAEIVVSTRDGEISKLYDAIEAIYSDGNNVILTRDDNAENDDISS